MLAVRQLSSTAVRLSPARRLFQTVAARQAITNLTMPAMSPTMTEGGIASWKKKEGEAFSSGDVLLEIETDKATIDVEAQDDGILGKILNVRVGKVIALLAEEGDDISNLQAPPEEQPSAPKQEPAPKQETPPPPSPPSPAPAKQEATPAVPPSHPSAIPESSRPLFPSVLRLLQENNIAKADDIKGTGVRGMLTKGDVLAYLGKASSPQGTYKETPSPVQKIQKTEKPEKAPKIEEPAALDGAAVRRLIVNNMLEASIKAQAAAIPHTPATFDSIIADYLPPSKPPSSSPAPASSKPKADADGLHGLS
ncbi:Pyruvate dehydrogenase complex protein X component, mitochondrial [Grifola frondosa]|uniref:Pyruvate dehydrogenase complex protein X component, mitochondrial n=1 Tax=Grifola frondosa TaxID=5627 RepID=A0A1C7MFL5_GRIFR|nr:Pyruvate dehydrogenase complex protein X component, mitochondrial [Grifola frondosa]